MNPCNNKKIVITLINLLFLVSIFLLVQTENALAKEAGVGRYALIKQTTGKVVNVILLNPFANWSPPAGQIVIASNEAGPGDTWDGEVFKKAPPPEPAPSPPIQAPGNDIAELMQFEESLIEPGDIVAVSEKGSGIRRSNKPYDKNMIGIISTNPGVVLGDSQGANQQKVALVGTVPVKVSTENGPIQIGDLLTSSSQPGVAMRATEPGRVIGMALEPLSEADFENCGTENSLKIENCELKIGRVMVFVNPHWSLGSLADDGTLENDQTPMTNAQTESEEKPTILSQFTLAVKNALKKLGLFIENGIVRVKKLLAKEICLEGEDGEQICINKNQLKELLEKNQSLPPTPPSDASETEPAVAGESIEEQPTETGSLPTEEPSVGEELIGQPATGEEPVLEESPIEQPPAEESPATEEPASDEVPAAEQPPSEQPPAEPPSEEVSQ